MISVRQTEAYDEWFAKVRDSRLRSTILARITRVRIGNFGDTKYLRDGVSELRIDLGPGYRLYFTRRGDTVVILLVGGEKSTQERDIRRAIEMAESLDI